MFAQAYKSQPRKSGVKPRDVCLIREVFPKAQFVSFPLCSSVKTSASPGLGLQAVALMVPRVFLAMQSINHFLDCTYRDAASLVDSRQLLRPKRRKL